VDELDHGREIDMLGALVSARARGEENRQGPKALASAVDDVVTDLVDQDHVGLKSTQDEGVHGLDVFGDWLSKPGNIHRLFVESALVAADARSEVMACQVDGA